MRGKGVHLLRAVLLAAVYHDGGRRVRLVFVIDDHDLLFLLFFDCYGSAPLPLCGGRLRAVAVCVAVQHHLLGHGTGRGGAGGGLVVG